MLVGWVKEHGFLHVAVVEQSEIEKGRSPGGGRPFVLFVVVEHQRVTDAHTAAPFRQLHDLVGVQALQRIP